MPPKMPRFRVQPSQDGQFYAELVGANGEVMLTSETYTRAADAVRGCQDVMRAVAAILLNGIDLIPVETVAPEEPPEPDAA